MVDVSDVVRNVNHHEQRRLCVATGGGGGGGGDKFLDRQTDRQWASDRASEWLRQKRHHHCCAEIGDGVHNFPCNCACRKPHSSFGLSNSRRCSWNWQEVQTFICQKRRTPFLPHSNCSKVIEEPKRWFFTAEKREERWSLKRIVTRSNVAMVTSAMFLSGNLNFGCDSVLERRSACLMLLFRWTNISWGSWPAHSPTETIALFGQEREPPKFEAPLNV